mmetsp:Transcript_37618/g.97065  ORF Transcript_37618/g.97065 Transcript_37618/m.97065 type:complete len:303 (-) Transcript_37618:651-1559(-)
METAEGVIDATKLLEERSDEKKFIEEGGLSFDLHYLHAINPSPFNDTSDSNLKDCEMKKVSTLLTEALVMKIFEQDMRTTEDGTIAALPLPSLVLPRQKPIPKARALTKWEQFALEKGIKNTKKDRMVWDEEVKDWKPRHGYKRAGAMDDVWALPAKATDEPGTDPFTKMKNEKKDRVDKNKKQQQRNLDRSKGLPMSVPARQSSLDTTLAVVRTSTASGGVFDKRLEGEKGKKKGPRQERPKPVETSSSKEKKSNLDVLEHLFGREDAGKTHAAFDNDKVSAFNIVAFNNRMSYIQNCILR